jgi:hypothetical protein
MPKLPCSGGGKSSQFDPLQTLQLPMNARLGYRGALFRQAGLAQGVEVLPKVWQVIEILFYLGDRDTRLHLEERAELGARLFYPA